MDIESAILSQYLYSHNLVSVVKYNCGVLVMTH